MLFNDPNITGLMPAFVAKYAVSPGGGHRRNGRRNSLRRSRSYQRDLGPGKPNPTIPAGRPEDNFLCSNGWEDGPLTASECQNGGRRRSPEGRHP
jgi:hypothetical protein